MQFTNEQLSAIVQADFGFMLGTHKEGHVTIELKVDELLELERLVNGYTEALAQYNTLSPGKQVTLDTLNDAWAKIANALRN